MRVLGAARQTDTLEAIAAAKTIGTFKGSAAEFVYLAQPFKSSVLPLHLSERDSVHPSPCLSSVGQCNHVQNIRRQAPEDPPVSARLHLAHQGGLPSSRQLWAQGVQSNPGRVAHWKLSLASVGAQRGRGELPRSVVLEVAEVGCE